MSELILGGQKSGKSRLAEDRARAWLAQSGQHRAILIATALPFDEEMQQRIARHRADRAQRVPGMQTIEELRDVAATIRLHSDPNTLLVVDCLTLWLTNLLMPASGVFLEQKGQVAGIYTAQSATDLIAFLPDTLKQSKGPVVCVSNEIGLGVIPLGREVRHFVDELGKLNQAVAAQCARVTLMVAGCPVLCKGVA